MAKRLPGDALGTAKQNEKNASFHEIVFRPASALGKDGVTSHTTYMVPRSGQGGGQAYEYRAEHKHHPTLQNLHEHIDEHMAEMYGQAGDESVEPSEEHKPNV